MGSWVLCINSGDSPTINDRIGWHYPATRRWEWVMIFRRVTGASRPGNSVPNVGCGSGQERPSALLSTYHHPPPPHTPPTPPPPKALSFHARPPPRPLRHVRPLRQPPRTLLHLHLSCAHSVQALRQLRRDTHCLPARHRGGLLLPRSYRFFRPEKAQCWYFPRTPMMPSVLWAYFGND